MLHKKEHKKKRTNESHEHIAKCKGEKNTEH